MMNKLWTLSPIIKMGLLALLVSLALILVVGRSGSLTGNDQPDVLLQTGIDLFEKIKLPEEPALLLSVRTLLSLIAYVVLTSVIIRLYVVQFKPQALDQLRYYWLLSLLLLLFVGAAWIIVPRGQLLAYLFPTATLSLLVAVLIDTQLSILVTFLMGLVVGYLADNSLMLSVYAVLGGLIGILSIGQVKRVNRLLRSGIYVALANVSVVFIFHFSNNQLESGGLLRLMGIGVANGVIAAALTLPALFLVDNLFGIVTPIRLLDLAQPTHPLLRRLILNAPGTYHHSLMVSNLAEQAAEKIGADTLLTRVGAYYHDVGKLQRPFFFIENQFRDINIHERLEPQVSAQTIISHVQDGLTLARKYRLPREVQAFIAEHHGTSLVEYFYHQACKAAADPAQVPEADFRYSGPKPQSRETALVMLADSCEATVRAIQPVSLEALDQLPSPNTSTR